MTPLRESALCDELTRAKSDLDLARDQVRRLRVVMVSLERVADAAHAAGTPEDLRDERVMRRAIASMCGALSAVQPDVLPGPTLSAHDLPRHPRPGPCPACGRPPGHHGIHCTIGSAESVT
jgi:hypothetical protein